MRYVTDLHSHSGYAGGVGDISLESVADTMAAKGIDAFGCGDCLQPAWRQKLQTVLDEPEPGLFRLQGDEGAHRKARFVLQTEVIITTPVASGGRKITHTVLLFPSFAAVDAAIECMRRWNVKLDIGRPFVKCDNPDQAAEHLTELARIDESIMVIPAHVMTPQGVYGSDRPVDSMRDVYGEFADRITTVETGLSSDPALLSLLPELDGRTLVSNSDCHSGALNRVGREYTALELTTPSYDEIVRALRSRRVRYTAEFDPAEGRYFLTGHKAGLERHGKDSCYYSPGCAPADGLCPICGKPLTVGVLDRVLYLARVQAPAGQPPRTLENAVPAQEAKTLVPLVEVLAAGMGIKNANSRKVTALFEKAIDLAGTEAELWEMTPADIDSLLSGNLPSRAVEAVVRVRAGDFGFQPGYDGHYGELRIGKKPGWFGHAAIIRG